MLKFSVAILAGGKSTRMGEEKTLIPIIGEVTFIEYIIRQINGFGLEHMIISNNPDAYQRFGLPVFADIFPNIGALGGIYSGLFYATYEHCLILAGDMPFINLQLLERIVFLAPDFDAVIPRWKTEEFAEPFRAIYSKSCLDPIKSVIEDGKRKVISFFPDINIRFLGFEEVAHFDPNGLTFFNVNTPEELIRARRLARDNEVYL